METDKIVDKTLLSKNLARKLSKSLQTTSGATVCSGSDVAANSKLSLKYLG